MSLPVLIILGVGVLLVVIVFVYSAMTFQVRKKRMSEKQRISGYLKRFRFYFDFVLTRGTFRKIYQQINSLSVYTMVEARITTVQFFERSMFSGLILFVIGFIGLGDVISGIVLLMFAFVMLNTTVNKRIDDVNFRTLKDISSFILSVRENYTRVRNVPDAINDAKCSSLLQRQVSEIYLIVTATDGSERLDRFYQTCPNRTLRTFATTCYVRADSGEDDLPQGKESPFKQSIGLIKDEVDMEVRRQINQRLMFGTLDKLPFVPLFMYPPIVIFYKNMISATAAVFDSSIGYVIKLAVVLACFVCYYILSTINNPSIARMDDRILGIAKLMQEHASVRKFARRLVVKKWEKRHKLQIELDGCISQKTLPYFYLEKTIMAFSLMVVSLIFTIIILISAKNATYNSIVAATMSATLTYTREQEIQTLQYDHQVCAMETCPTEEELRAEFERIFPKYSTIEIDAQIERLQNKHKTYRALTFKWWFAFISIACWFAGYNIPNLLLKLRVKMVASESELDVLQLQTIIAVLMDTNLDTFQVIYWLSKSSDIHKDILTFCYHEYVRDPEYALRRLRDKTPSAEFSSMCDKLITTISQVTLAEAFEDLVGERTNTMKVREVVQLEQLKSKRNLAGPVAMAPMMVWMVAVFILPIGIVAIRSAVSMLGQLNF